MDTKRFCLLRGLILLSILLACAIEAWAAEAPLAVEIRRVSKETGDCPEKGCINVQISYPEIQSAPSPAVKETILTDVKEALSLPEGSGQKSASLETAVEGEADSYLEEFRRYRGTFPKLDRNWFVKRTITIHSNLPSLLSLDVETQEYLGSAHPNSSRQFLNYDPQSGRRLALSDVLVPGFEERLNSIAEQKFRKVRGLPASQSLRAAGFTFKGDRFGITENVGFGEKGLVFYYNAYEVAPYALGSTEVFVAYSEISDLLQKNIAPLAKAEEVQVSPS